MATLKDSHTTGDGYDVNIQGTNWFAQTFEAGSSYTIISVKLKLWRTGGLGDLDVSIRNTSGDLPTGEDLSSGSIVVSTITTSSPGLWYEITLGTGTALTSGTRYAIVMRAVDCTSLSRPDWRVENPGTYSTGRCCTSGDSGSNWAGQVYDGVFETYAVGIVVDKTYSKKLIAIANNEVWYEASAGTMSELSDAHNGIDTTNPLTIVEAFQKLFIANTTNLKVADFINTKITTDNVGANPPDPGTVLTSTATGNPSMIVDYITTLSSACVIYGKRITTTAFGNSETVEGTDDDGNAISFTTSAAETAPPHWYSWTVFGADSAFGTMPDSAYLVARYRGRLVLSGNPDYPHQWYMSKVGAPFNFAYGSTDPLTAVAGNNVDAGEVGDIVRALIPFGDDFLIFGCANSIHLLDGDPAHGGSIDELDNKTGIFGPWAWCIDGVGDLWFYGTGGLYKMAGGRSRPVNISQAHLPKLVTTWGAVPETHRIVLTYDPFRNGIIISRTTLTDGTNLNYYYDFKTEGFYPEIYPNACGILSSHYYDSDATSTKGMVLGCNDGYIRNFYDIDKDDDAGDGNTAISSYVTWPIEHLAEDNDKEGKLTSLTVELAGGASGGDFGDTNGVSWELHKGRDAETVLEDIKGGATAFASGTLSGTGRKNRIRVRVRGAYLGIKFLNSTSSETFAINRVFGDVREVGKIK